MCRTLGCFMSMPGHGRRVGSLGDLLAMLGQSSHTEQAPTTQEEFLQRNIEDQEMNIRMAETVIGILKAPLPETAVKLVDLTALKPKDPEKHGFATVATYEQASGGFLVVGTDHLSQAKVSHSTPNIHGLEGLQTAIEQELAKMAAEGEGQPKQGEAVAEQPQAEMTH